MKFRLTAVHHINDRLVPEGTIVGDGTDFPVVPPGMFMEPLDEEAKAAYEKHMAKWKGKPPPTEIMQPPTALQPGQKMQGTEVKSTVPPPGPSGFGPGPVGTKVEEPIKL